jgi:hypothetical protein
MAFLGQRGDKLRYSLLIAGDVLVGQAKMLGAVYRHGRVSLLLAGARLVSQPPMPG